MKTLLEQVLKTIQPHKAVLLYVERRQIPNEYAFHYIIEASGMD
jgi:hypothetical protein